VAPGAASIRSSGGDAVSMGVRLVRSDNKATQFHNDTSQEDVVLAISRDKSKSTVKPSALTFLNTRRQLHIRKKIESMLTTGSERGSSRVA
jgi:hypothetical protein